MAVLATTLFVSNLLSWTVSGYSDAAAAQKAASAHLVGGSRSYAHLPMSPSKMTQVEPLLMLISSTGLTRDPHCVLARKRQLGIIHTGREFSVVGYVFQSRFDQTNFVGGNGVGCL